LRCAPTLSTLPEGKYFQENIPKTRIRRPGNPSRTRTLGLYFSGWILVVDLPESISNRMWNDIVLAFMEGMLAKETI
jgi:hypothetical protein